MYSVQVRQPEGKRSLGRPSHKGKENINMWLNEIERDN